MALESRVKVVKFGRRGVSLQVTRMRRHLEQGSFWNAMPPSPSLRRRRACYLAQVFARRRKACLSLCTPELAFTQVPENIITAIGR